ncbi:hypothetical protein RJT34_02780 [Clitoria ternatea]|uniref:Uncharacterized protein n=1 Tax=Clitoria ternatea TaxID=43366 RepID=A0AAN9KKZ5_CLITE
MFVHIIAFTLDISYAMAILYILFDVDLSGPSQIWELNSNRTLVMVAIVRCEEIANEKYDLFTSNEVHYELRHMAWMDNGSCMACYLLWLWIYFKEPPHENERNLVPYQPDTGPTVRVAVEKGHTQPLLMNSDAKEHGEDATENEDAEETRKPVTFICRGFVKTMPGLRPSVWPEHIV